ncbi:MAG TPA: SurA N-terminal domain-containing protein [Verrucomicrobiae bacterium]|nr:SurA N-terminal domain-containing protein [Verrucomicrobiae bacterium]
MRPLIGMKVYSFLAVAAVLGTPSLSADFRLSNGIAAVANDSVITVQEVQTEVKDVIELYDRTYYNNPTELESKRIGALTKALEDLIDRQLVLHDFKNLGGVIQESYIDDEIKRRVRERYGDRVTLTKSLQAQGITQEAFRQKMRDEIITYIMRRKNVNEALLISPAKIEHYYTTNLIAFKMDDQVKLRMIMISCLDVNSVDDTLRLTSQVKTKIDGGASFADMAVVYSEDLYKKEGGLWGWVGEKKLLKGLSEIAFGLNTGVCSRVVARAPAGEDSYWIYQYDQSNKVSVARKFGEPHLFLEERKFPKGGDLEDLPALPQNFYLLYAEDKQAARTRPLPEVRDEIERDLLVLERTRLERKWIDRLRAKAFVRRF